MTFQSYIDRIYAILTKRVVYHSLFWILLFGTMLFTGMQSSPFETSLWNEIISIIFYMALVYFNLYYLIPNYLANHAGKYFIFLFLSCLIITPIKVLAYFILFSSEPLAQQQLIANQGLIVTGFVFIVFLSTILKIFTDWWRHQQEKVVLQTKSMQTELRFLRSQINPHFLFNTLNNLYALTLKKSDKAPEIVLKLSEIMRYMLYECNEKEVLLENEVTYVRNYLDLERLRQPKGSNIDLEVIGTIGSKTIVPLLFVPFLENSFKHGLNQYIGASGYVRVQLDVKTDHVFFVIENSKSDSIVRLHSGKSGGIGLSNVRQRLQLLYPNRHELKIKDEPSRYIVELKVFL